jgi:hypothetical protein
MRVDASSAGDMPALAGLRRSMGALGQVFCTFLRLLPRIRCGVGVGMDVGVAVGFSQATWDFETRNRPKDQYFPSCPVCARICAGGSKDKMAKKVKASSLLSLFILLPLVAFAQTGAGEDFQITKITKNLILAPQFTYAGAGQYQTNQRDRWLEVEVEFKATPELTDELTFKYYILFNGTLLTGEVTHVNIPAGRENRSVMYVPPRALARFGNNRPITLNSCQNVAVQILQQGTVKSEASLNRAAPQWFTSLEQVSGFVLNKNQTPFAPLYWDRYEQIKTAR